MGLSSVTFHKKVQQHSIKVRLSCKERWWGEMRIQKDTGRNRSQRRGREDEEQGARHIKGGIDFGRARTGVISSSPASISTLRRISNTSYGGQW